VPPPEQKEQCRDRCEQQTAKKKRKKAVRLAPCGNHSEQLDISRADQVETEQRVAEKADKPKAKQKALSQEKTSRKNGDQNEEIRDSATFEIAEGGNGEDGEQWQYRHRSVQSGRKRIHSLLLFV